GAGVGERAGAPAEPVARLQHRDAEPVLREPHGRRKAGESAADHQNGGGHRSPHFTSHPEAHTASLRHFGTLTRRVNTSYPSASMSSRRRLYEPHMMWKIARPSGERRGARAAPLR